MTVKQMLFPVLILGATASIALAIEEKTTLPEDILPALGFIHHIHQQDIGYEKYTNLTTEITFVTKEMLNKIKAMPEENGFIRSIECPCSIKGLPSKITLYNPKNPYLGENEFNPCAFLEKELLEVSPERFNILAQILPSKK